MFERIKAFIGRWNELHAVDDLTDHELDDLGLTRDQVRAFVMIPHDVADRMLTMAAIFGIPEAEIQRDHARYLDLLESCCTCADRGACALALAKGELTRARDCGFCVNARAFADLAPRRAA